MNDRANRLRQSSLGARRRQIPWGCGKTCTRRRVANAGLPGFKRLSEILALLRLPFPSGPLLLVDTSADAVIHPPAPYHGDNRGRRGKACDPDPGLSPDHGEFRDVIFAPPEGAARLRHRAALTIAGRNGTDRRRPRPSHRQRPIHMAGAVRDGKGLGLLALAPGAVPMLPEVELHRRGDSPFSGRRYSNPAERHPQRTMAHLAIAADVAAGGPSSLGRGQAPMALGSAR